MTKNQGIIIGILGGAAIAAVAVGVYIASAIPLAQITTTPTRTTNESVTEKVEVREPIKAEVTTIQWQEISHSNFWKNPEFFSNQNYNFADIKFSHPSNWIFSCCSDMGDRSVHTIYSSADQNEQLPFITITDYSLSGCPANRPQCSLDEIVKKTPDEKYQELIGSISKKATILPGKLLGYLGTTAYHYQVDESIFFNYQMVDPDFNYAKVDSYIIVTDKDVVEITFSKYTQLPTGFIDEFLQRIGKD